MEPTQTHTCTIHGSVGCLNMVSSGVNLISSNNKPGGIEGSKYEFDIIINFLISFEDDDDDDDIARAQKFR